MPEKENNREPVRCRLAVVGFVTFAAFFLSSYTGAALTFVLAGISAASAVLSFVLRKQTALLASAAACAAFLIYGIYLTAFVLPCARLCGNTYPVTARVTAVNAPDNDTVRVTADGNADGVNVRFSFYSSDKGLSRGDVLEADVSFSELPKTASYSENYDYSRGIFTRAYIQGAVNVTQHGETGAYDLITAGSLYLREAVRENLSGDEGALLLAMFFGDKSEMSPALSANIRKCGLSHMTAVSGMHISLIIIVIAGLLELCGLKAHPRLRFLVIAGFTAVFAVFFGMTASVRRSALMMIIYYGASLFGRKTVPLNSLGAAMLIILLTEPCACRDAGLILSVCGTFGAGCVSPALCKRFHGRFAFTAKADALITGVCATYCTLPVSMLIFGGIPLLGVFTTIAAYPFFFAAMICTLIFAASGGLLVSAALLPAGAALKPLASLINAVGGLRYSYITVDEELILPFIAASAVFIAVCAVLSRKARKGSLYTVLSAAVCFCALSGLVTAQRLTMSGITRITVYSDGKDAIAALQDDSGVSVFASGINEKISSAALDALTERSADGFRVMAVYSAEKRSSVYSGGLDDIKADVKRLPDGGEGEYDVNGGYTVRIRENAAEADINGVSLIFADAKDAEAYGAHDIAIYSGYKKSADTVANGVTVHCDKRYKDAAHNAYYRKTVILINKNGEYLIK